MIILSHGVDFGKTFFSELGRYSNVSPRPEKLHWLRVQLSERFASLGNHGCPIEDTPQTSQHYSIEGFKVGP